MTSPTPRYAEYRRRVHDWAIEPDNRRFPAVFRCRMCKGPVWRPGETERHESGCLAELAPPAVILESAVEVARRICQFKVGDEHGHFHHPTDCPFDDEAATAIALYRDAAMDIARQEARVA